MKISYLYLICSFVPLVVGAAAEPKRPNILWITSEDNGPQLGCYGDTYATTPHLDALAARSLRYRNVWSTAPVCAPARTTIISGLYPTATGAEHMRSMTRLPERLKMYPQFLREAGYYCSNNSKEDYNLAKPKGLWDDSSPRAHWKNRQPGQPFFAIFNHTVTHESQVRRRPHQLVHDPNRAPVPAYHPNVPEVRRDWAQYYDNLTTMDGLVAKNLRELADAGLAEDTIIFYYGDHGAGMPRSKRWPYNSGLQVPLIVHIPERWKHLAPPDYAPGAISERLVSFADLAPTLLNLVGVNPPDYLHGRAFLGPNLPPAPKYLHGFRGRMDECYDLVRSVRDTRFVYVRNYMPHRIYGQYIDYMFQTPTTRVWRELFEQQKLQPPRTFFWQPKPAEELYDLQEDPDEVRNLADSPAHQEILARLRKAQEEFILQVRDVGFLPEGEIHERSRGLTPYELGRDHARYPLERIARIADLASRTNAANPAAVAEKLNDPDSAVRYWAATGLLIRGADGLDAARPALLKAQADASSYVRVVVAEIFARHGDAAQRQAALKQLVELAALDKHGVYVSLTALNALANLGPAAAPVREAISQLPRNEAGLPERMRTYVPRAIENTLAALSD